VDIGWQTDFGRWLDRLEEQARSGDQRSRTFLTFTARALDQLRSLADPPGDDDETATCGRFGSHAGISCGAPGGGRPPDLLVPARVWHRRGRSVRGEKAKLGDVFYDSVAARADPLIDQWKRETGYEEKS
jgi:hypothetical protein